MTTPHGYWPSRWPGEDGGPTRRQTPLGGGGSLGLIGRGGSLRAHSRTAMASTMVVLREPGELYLLCHTGGPASISWVEQIDPITLQTLRRSPDLPGGPPWPGGIAAHANGSLYVVFGQHAHRLDAGLEVLATATLPRERPYNSFLILPDGMLVTKDFGGLRAGQTEPDGYGASEVVILEPESLREVARRGVPEPSTARLSADGNDVYVVGDSSLWRVHWDGRTLSLDPSYRGLYRTEPGQTYGWDAVIESGAAWFLDNGAGTEGYTGSLLGVGHNTAPLHLVHVNLSTADVMLTEVCGLPGGIVANPPVVDPVRRIVVAYDSGNGIVAGFRTDAKGRTSPLWQRPMNHAAHPLRYADSGELVLGDYDRVRQMDQVVVIDIETGAELARADTGSPVQSVLFAAPGFERDFYLCSFTTITRVEVV